MFEASKWQKNNAIQAQNRSLNFVSRVKEIPTFSIDYQPE
jgi:hypothetical protein